MEFDGVEFHADDEAGVLRAYAAVDFCDDLEYDASAVDKGTAVLIGAVVGGWGQKLG